jgi:uroporphyrinogen decarboxylase
MNSRERVLASLSHREPDRVPFDLGSTVVTGISDVAYRGLRRELGLPDREPVIIDVIQQIAQIDDDVMDVLGVDAEGVSPRSSATFQIEIKDGGDHTYFYDEFGIGWRMPKRGGLYYDMFESPLSGDDMTPAVMRAHPWPDPLDPRRFVGLRSAAQAVRDSGRAVVVGSMSAGVLEIFAWTRGFMDYFTDLAADPALAEAFLEQTLELQMAYWDRMIDEIGDLIDVASTADDFSGQHGLLFSLETYRRLVKPRHARLFELIHRRSNAKVFFHSCGSVRNAIPDLIDAGVDILNPVQVSATGMDSADLKREYGRDLVFWGGGVDTQHVLGVGTPDQVRDEVRRRVLDFMPGGGFVFNTVHNIQANVPPANIVAMWETLREYGVYSAG